MIRKKDNLNNFGKKLVMAPAVIIASLGICLLCLVYLNNSDLNTKHDIDKKVLGAENTEPRNTKGTEITDNTDILFWQKIVEEIPTYRDGWIRLAVGYYEDGNIDKAIEALDKAEEIDPNNETIKSLNKIMQR